MTSEVRSCCRLIVRRKVWTFDKYVGKGVDCSDFKLWNRTEPITEFRECSTFNDIKLQETINCGAHNWTSKFGFSLEDFSQ